jgi:hypothetical protein
MSLSTLNPDASWWRRFGTSLLGLLPSEGQL